MQKFIFFLAFMGFYLFSFPQIGHTTVCRLGFTFEVSQQPSWGYAKPVVLTVTPNTSANAQGLEVNDIIEEINGQSTAGQTVATIIEWLQNSRREQVNILAVNLTESKEIILTQACISKNALIEKDLASVYSFYSLEDEQTRSFTCPFKTKVHSQADLMTYRTFGFSKPDPANRDLEDHINVSILNALEKKGLKYDGKNPDMLVYTSYSFHKNPNYRRSPNVEKLPVVCRYNMHTQAMENLPIYYNPLIHPNQAEFFLNMHIRLVDRKKSNDALLYVVWECETKESIQSGHYGLDKYSGFHIPLMFMQYPYIKSTETASFYYSRSKYNYTGIHYNMNNLKEVIGIDLFSPAANAELQPNDVIERINGIKFNSNPKSADNNYKQFIFKTMPLRDPGTQFANAEGFTKCMYWDKLKYAQVYDEFKKPAFTAAFSYLFYFAPYINLSGSNIIHFSVLRGKQRLEIKVKPIIVTEEIFKNQ